jgi:hypothetical protein
MTTVPADIANQALDSLGHPMEKRIGDLQEGTVEAQVVLRNYGTALRQISRSAHWNCLRRRLSMTLLNDATGNTTRQQQQAGGPVTVGPGTVGMRPWVYEYAWPVDCVKARFVPATQIGGPGPPAGNIALPPNPLMSGLNQGFFPRQVPSRFVVSNDVIPTLIGYPAAWNQIPDTSQTLGQGLSSQTVILSNQICADLVYTALITYPDQWDPLFRQAFVALLASQIVMGVTQDRKLALSLRQEQISVCKMALEQARISDGNEGFFSVDHQPDWLRIRNTGAWNGSGWGWDGLGVLGYGWDSCGFADGSAY